MTSSWNSKLLGDLVSEDNPICYGILMPGEHLPNGVPVIKVKNFEGGYLRISQLLCTSPEIDNHYRRSRTLPNDILLSIRGTVGEVAVVPSELPASNITQDTARIRVNHLVYIDFLVQALRSEVVQSQIRHRTIGQAVKGINIACLRKLEIPFPEFNEQKAIATVLSSWDRAIRQLTDLIAAKVRFKQGLMQQLLTGQRRFKGYDEPLVTSALGEVARFVNGRAFKPNDWKTKGLPIIRIQNLNGSKEFNFFEGEYELKHLIKSGDLLFSWSGSRGTSFGSFFWSGPDGLLNQHIFRVIPTESIRQRYLGHLLRYVTTVIEKKAHGSAGLVHITKGELEKVQVNYSRTLNEQDCITTILDAADREIGILGGQLDALKQQKKGMMQKLLTGAVRVKP